MEKSKTVIALILLVAFAIFSPSTASAETYEYPDIQFLPESMDKINWSALDLDNSPGKYKLIGVQGAGLIKMKDVGEKHVIDLPPNTLVVINYNLRIIEMVELVGIDILAYEYGIAVVKK
ncbi:MAG: hypothetical protein V1867_01265 [Candidatus Falkowbacteria bacterium]